MTVFDLFMYILLLFCYFLTANVNIGRRNLMILQRNASLRQLFVIMNAIKPGITVPNKQEQKICQWTTIMSTITSTISTFGASQIQLLN